MGISNFHNWLRIKYPECFDQHYGNNIYDFIYIDINFLLHHAIYDSKNYDDFTKRFYSQLNIIFSNFIATKQIIFAIDGPSPYAKILLQRKRRKLNSNYESSPDPLHPLNLTPGTDLMFKIEKDLHDYCTKLKRKYKFIKPEMHIISFKDPDEGEIKICHRIFLNGSKDIDKKHLIIGNDADIVVMSMALKPIYNIDILIRTNGLNEIISIKKLIDINKQYIKNKNIYNSHFRSDFVIMSFMMGNDYLPKVGFVTFEKLWDAYDEFSKIYDEHMISHNTFNLHYFRSYLYLLLKKLVKPKQFVSIKEYNPNKLNNYLEGLLWCYNMYSKGKCNKYDFICSDSYSPNLSDLLFHLHAEKFNNIIPMSDTIPIPYDIYSLIIMPKSFIPDKYKDIVNGKLNHLYESIQCDTCNEIHNELSKLHKQMIKVRKSDGDTTEIRKNIGLTMKKHKEHKLTHDVKGFNVNDIKEIIEVARQLNK